MIASKSAIALLASLLLSASAWAEEPRATQSEVRDLIAAHHCRPVPDFFRDRPGADRPPFALGSTPAGKRLVAAWCQAGPSASGRAPTYTLLLRVDDPGSPFHRCPRVLAGRQAIGGLEFVAVSEPAANFHHVDDMRPVAQPQSFVTRGIRSEYDGLSEVYVCIGGRWAFKALD